jgi:small conductance mechanosensitive channel
MTDQALISAKETSDGITSAIGLNKGMFTWDNLLSAAIALVVCILAIMIIMKILRKMFSRSKMEPSLAGFILKVIKVALEFAAVMIVAGSLGFDVTALLAVFSLLGLAISLSVQNLLGNLVSGVVLLMNKPIRDGDYIQAGGAEGVVKNIGLFYTELTTLDNKTVSVPNSELSAGQIVNFTREDNRRVDLVVGASYECDTEDVKKALYDAIARTDKVLADPAPQVLVEEFGASVIKYTVRAWCKHEDYWDVHYGINDNVLAAFNDAGVKMSYEHVNVHMVQD